MGRELGDLKNRHNETIRIKPKEDPATIIVNIINRAVDEIINIFIIIRIKIDISISSSLNNKIITFFRHQYNLVILIKIIILIILIKVFPTSKVGDLNNLKEFLKLALMLGVIFVLSIQPIIIISRLIMVVLIYSFYLYWNLREFWFRYIIVLVLMRGVLVVFTYIIRVLPNERFEVSRLVILILGFVLIYKGEVYDEFIQNMRIGRIKIWSGISLIVRLFLIIYLLFIIVIVVWLRIIERGAIRIS